MNNHKYKKFVYNLYNLNDGSFVDSRETYIGINDPLYKFLFFVGDLKKEGLNG